MYRRRVLLLVVLISISLLVFGPISNTPTYAQAAEAYYPSAYNLFNETAFVSGWNNLQADDGNYTIYGSYPTATSNQTLYAHQETKTIVGTPYYLQKLESADASGTSLSAPMNSTGRQLLGKFVYQLTGVTSIPASTWTVYYRTWASVPSGVVTKNASSVPAGTWTDPTNAYASNNLYATTTTNTATQEYGNYGFSIPGTAVITKVEVGYEAYTAGNEKIGVTLSWDNGSNWFDPEFVSSPLGPVDPDTVTWVDFTTATNWTINKLSDANFRTRVKNVKAGAPSNVYLDWIPVKVTYATPSFVAHADVDILIRKADGTIAQTIATDVANSANLTTIAQTLNGTYSWSVYPVVDQTDYLEIDYYIDVTTAQSDATAYLRIDDNTLPLADQTRATNIILPSEYTMEVEFTGSSDLFNWTQLVWTVDSAWTTGIVSVTLQLYNYTLGAYPTSGDGYIAYTSSATPNTDETKNQTIITDPTSFRNSTDSSWKVKIKGVKATTTPFDFKADLIKYETTTVALSDVAVFSVTPSATEAYPTWTVPLNITVVVVNEGALNETFWVATYYNLTATDWALIGNQTVTNLTAGENETLTFSWAITGLSVGTYLINATASVLPGEVDTEDNVIPRLGVPSPTVRLRLTGDVNDDDVVNILDVKLVKLAFSLIIVEPMADLNGDGVVNILDVKLVKLAFSGII